MKRFISCLAILMCCIMFIPALPTVALSNTSATEETPLSYSYNGYKTYLLSDSTFKWTVPDTTEGGTTCTAVQGMNTGTTYCYVAKRNSNDTYADITRINMDNGDKAVMNYYASTSATTSTACNTLGHANEIAVIGVDDINYMWSATLIAGKALTRLKIDGTKLMFTGYFDLITASGNSVSCSAIAHIKTSGGYIYLLLKRANAFYYCKISETAKGGSASSPTKVTIYKIFDIDTRNAMYANSNSSASTLSVDDWTNQGCGYNKSEKVLYVPIWDSNTGNRNIIITYNLADIDTMITATDDVSKRIYPTKTSFMLQDTSVSAFEIESVGFRTGQGTTGDLKMYFNINCSTASKEGVYACNYKSGTGDFTSLDTGAVLWTTKYAANGGDGSMSNTYHIRNISTMLRTNEFTRTGYTFAGWYLKRKSDRKWLYFDSDGVARWYSKGSQPKTSVLALYENKSSVAKLTGVSGDIVTCYAQWTPNSTGTTKFYIQYDANGGTGTMADTEVTYGTTISISTNAYTREGYVFTGWTAYRRNKAQWCYKGLGTLSDSWLTVDASTDGYMLKTYADGANVAKTSSVDTDIVTFYASWSRVANASYPSSITHGCEFTLCGTIESTTDMHNVVVNVKDSTGTVVASHSATPYTNSYNLSAANTSISFSGLAAGNYTYEVQMSTINSSTPKYYTLLSTAFEIIDPAKLELTNTALSEGVYVLDSTHFKGFPENTSAAELKSLFQYDVSVVDANGNAVTDSTYIGTGYVINCAGQQVTAVLNMDVNCDAVVSTLDFVVITALVKNLELGESYVQRAADADDDGVISTLDVILIKRNLKQ